MTSMKCIQYMIRFYRRRHPSTLIVIVKIMVAVFNIINIVVVVIVINIVVVVIVIFCSYKHFQRQI